MQGREVKGLDSAPRMGRGLPGPVSECLELAPPTPEDGAEDALEVFQRIVHLLQRWGGWGNRGGEFGLGGFRGGLGLSNLRTMWTEGAGTRQNLQGEEW